MEAVTNAIQTRKSRRRNIITLSVLGALIVLVFLISMNTGVIRLSPVEVVTTLFGGGTDKQNLVLFDFRLPRIVISLLIGAGLAVSGCVMQGISRNALADPGILGINAGAGLMVMLFISFFPNTTAAPIYLLPVLALIGAGLTAALICVLAYKKNQGFKPTGLLLTGIAVAAGISAAMIVLTLRLSPEKYQFVAVWLAGSIWGSSWKFVLALLPWILVLLPFVMYKAQVMNVLNLGESMATGLGASVTREQLKLLAAAVGLAASCVAVSGGIGFVGLIAPHLGRRLVGAKHQMLLPVTAMIGALLVITADTLSRSILQPSEIPTGIVVAVIGAPYFLYLLSRTRA
ncbi:MULTISPECIES: iron ABC transporter permease [Paenibacillus]|uniref:Transport system permease protein n=2 Tax=Paenibacillus lactis TaxID=228574 RepID=G4HGV7_9BACL|nr:iron ABC transporter permease [Paenibacillus lactis]EHB63980.1 transport system permease protein [Paenibacillus lactis 154]MBP1895001.1 iron complex transport system permease protein [Paenibacillus lactis]GIO91975.1 iron ABC transporter permease [Paenibacillus lactis]HAF96769.1 iron ABC transporter permease [Paenibacillus lactis]